MKYMIKIMPVLFLALMLAGPVSVAAAQKENGIETDLEDGEYSIQVDLEGGSGKGHRQDFGATGLGDHGAD